MLISNYFKFLLPLQIKITFLCCSNHVLQISDGIESMGGVRLELLGYLVLAWVLVYLVIWKGLQNSGKVLKYNYDLTYLKPMCNLNDKNSLKIHLLEFSLQS